MTARSVAPGVLPGRVSLVTETSLARRNHRWHDSALAACKTLEAGRPSMDLMLLMRLRGLREGLQRSARTHFLRSAALRLAHVHRCAVPE